MQKWFKNRWKSDWESRSKHVMVPSITVEEACFDDMPRIWSCFCRARLTCAVIKVSDYKYDLTGIHLMHRSDSSLYFPKDPDIARIGVKVKLGADHSRDKKTSLDSDIFTEFWAASMGRQPPHYKGNVHGFIVHAHCWALLNRVLGATPRPTEIRLKKLILSSRKYWRNQKLHGLEDYNFHQSIANQARAPQYEHGCDIYQNPLVIPALQEVITREKTRAAKDRIRPGLSKFPMEINILISEWVCPVDCTLEDITDMRNMLLAFQWRLPDWFWRRRLNINENLIFELDILRKSGSPVDWQILKLGLMGLHLDPKWYSRSGLPNRERIIRNILAIKDLGVS
ncbi:uncharacterized protein N7503_002151 [Penicillium pulvis]|uniref:uncharacterized protein n=1 Tax=Penicillium pulvis TaxID=1562058 RepID=UPI002547F996|nr:uncharacterized protein N7503_002151 [Penicillium pulvis]KAJ5809933.1 hypothetical protein N7503_002151 [Penicillium pulvis]